MRIARYLFALLSTLVAVAVAGGPLGCQPPPPPEAPQAPEQFQPPPGGNCCLRGNENTEAACGAGVQRCCSSKIADRDDCEAAGGFWFHSTEGCKGAC